MALTDLGAYREAHDLAEDTLARSRRVLGDDHPDTLQVAHLLANCFDEMGAFERARQLDTDTLAGRRVGGWESG